MAKHRTIFFCQNCGASSPKWIGNCPSCGNWNSYVEEVLKNESAKNATPAFISTKINREPKLIHEIDFSEENRIITQSTELNRVLGGGIVQGSLILVGGEPGIGKSTLMLQIALGMQNKKILYITGEESAQQIKMRADRLKLSGRHCYILTETCTQDIFRQIENVNPEVLIVDSIQTLYTDTIDSAAGSVSQIRECASELQKYSKTTQIPVFLIGHITKDGAIAGPKLLEHMVDTVLQFEGDRNYGYRILRSTKNRFGSTSELGIFEMQNAGLREVSNPSEILISQREEEVSGVAIASTMEGSRPMMIEVQALVSSAAYGTPQRSSTGFDLRRLSMLLAVLEKRNNFRIGVKDVFLNIAGGVKVDDPAIDLAVISAILSSHEDIPLEQKICFSAEVGLSGEIRPVNRIEQRIQEAAKLGFQQILISKYNLKGTNHLKSKIELIPVKKIEEVFSRLFG